MSLAGTVKKLSRLAPVTRRSLLVIGDDGRPDGAQTRTDARVVVHLQRKSAGTNLQRRIEGDDTTGDVFVWVTDAAVAAAYDPAAPLVPLGWTTLQIAPAEDADGPPGDFIDWNGIRYEVTAWLGWDESFGGGARFQSYAGMERGATP